MDEVVIWGARPIAERLAQQIPASVQFASSREDFEHAGRRVLAAFLDGPRLASVDPRRLRAPVVAVLDDDLAGAIPILESYPWVSHVVGIGLVESPLGATHLPALLDGIREAGRDLNVFLPGDVKGRLARLVLSDGRAARVDKVGQYFEKEQLGARAVHTLRDVAEELLTNAFYDAPVAGGFFPQPISRTRKVKLPPERPCEISYGVRGSDLVFVRVQDRFGGLTRERLVSVLRRCSRTDMKVSIDESMGGAGLGLWRIFSAASFVAIAVTPAERCEILVGVQRRATGTKARPGRAPFAIHMFFDAPLTDAVAGTDLFHDSALDGSITLRVS